MTAVTEQARPFLYHIFYSFCNPLITLRVAAELSFPVSINSSHRNIILHDVLLQLHSIFQSTKIKFNHGQSYPIFGFWFKKSSKMIFGKISALFFSDFGALPRVAAQKVCHSSRSDGVR